jgi:hypothetical protein
MAENTKENKVLIAKARPREYPATETQIHVIKAAEYCGIHKGMSRTELMDKMFHCIPEYHRLVKEGKLNGEKRD